MPANPPDTSTGFVSLGDYLNANQAATNNMVGGLNAGVTSAGDKAQGEANTAANQAFQGGAWQGQHGGNFDPTTLADYTSAANDARSASTQANGMVGQNAYGGVSDAIAQKYHSTGGNNDLDTNLALAGNGGSFQANADKYGNLGGYLDNQVGNSYKAGNAAGQAALAAEGPPNTRTSARAPGSNTAPTAPASPFGPSANTFKTHPAPYAPDAPSIGAGILNSTFGNPAATAAGIAKTYGTQNTDLPGGDAIRQGVKGVSGWLKNNGFPSHW
ncbi:MAG: hypothetical protein NVS3B25_09880 [Hymenobacter sp.]